MRSLAGGGARGATRPYPRNVSIQIAGWIFAAEVAPGIYGNGLTAGGAKDTYEVAMFNPTSSNMISAIIISPTLGLG